MTTVTKTQQQSQRPAMNPWLVLAFICLPVFIGALDLTVVSAFLPELIVDLEIPLQTGLDDAAWIVSAYLLAYSVSLTFMGRVSDLVGRRVVYVVCLLIFIVGSVLVATAQGAPSDLIMSLLRRMGQRPDPSFVDLQAIIFGRIVQALGAGALVPVSLALVADLFPPGKRTQPLGLIGAVDTLGWVLGHLYGGIFVQTIPWQGLFWVNVPLTLLALAFVVWALRGVPQHRTGGRFDIVGAVLIVGTLICLNLGLGANIEISATTSLDTLRDTPPYNWPVIGAGAVLFLLFIVVELRVRHPLFDLRMFRKRQLSAGALTNLFVGYCLFIGLVSVPILINVSQTSFASLREAALVVGILLSALTVPMAIAALPGGWLAERIGFRNTTVLGLGLAMVGFALIWQTWHFGISHWLVAAEMLVIGVGIGLTFSPISAAVINAAGEEEHGAASALVLVLRLIGMTVSISSLTTFALNRVNALAVDSLGAEAALNLSQYANEYATITVQVLAEMGLIGLVLAGIALIPAWLIGSGRVDVRHQTSETTEVKETIATPMGD